ncbi:hypothetical protein [Nostoc sp.]
MKNEAQSFVLADGETNPEYLIPFLCEAAPNPFNFFLSFFVSFATAVATTGSHCGGRERLHKASGVGTPATRCLSFAVRFSFLYLNMV